MNHLQKEGLVTDRLPSAIRFNPVRIGSHSPTTTSRYSREIHPEP